jgi:hypothetical protein
LTGKAPYKPAPAKAGIADQIRPKVAKLAALMDEAETDVLASSDDPFVRLPAAAA